MWAPGEEQYVPQPEDTEAEAQAEEEARLRWEASLRAQCSAVRRQFPLLWEAFDEGTMPMAEPPQILVPTLPLTSAETMAYRMGQRSIFEWMRRCADIAEEGGNDAADAEGTA